ncbi:hypothetical protein HF324_17055 [Chitinophaga oryzae]|uniref:Uncharacterized protein n=1 Tax=Chitinophaga oryzae TaxID=2725414 RepID=A0AAE6ZHU7_9BACT|nr:hypothetical protein [Chitinophaga oryzae]QJB32998.1 hypothetical protein HF329_17425 [Chitinophaga oryzae]QJB39472.1 hypothetical protein HF324_17055 [Chitinophaga oryzae]
MKRANTGATERKWITIALINLMIVAVLGVLLRTRILFPLPGINFGYWLYAHSHFAVGGWITLCLFTLMTYRLLPAAGSGKRIYPVLLTGVLISSVGMLLSFPFQGYALFSIIFSTLFMVCTWAFGWVFVRDLLKAGTERSVTLLAAGSLVSLALSCVGPFSLAYMMATHQRDTVFYHDAIYTYLHLQYNGFFALGVFSLFCHHLGPAGAEKVRYRFALALCASVLPTLFLSYLWHQPPVVIRVVAGAGSVLLLLVLARFAEMARSVKPELYGVNPFARRIGALALMAFALKTLAQLLTIFPAVGNAIFSNRPVIVMYLHLVMLGFVTLYLFAQLLYAGFFATAKVLAGLGMVVFIIALVFNEVLLVMQGLPGVFKVPAEIYLWGLWLAAMGLLVGAGMVALAAGRGIKVEYSFKSELNM